MTDPDAPRRSAALRALHAAEARGIESERLRHVYAREWTVFPVREDLRRIGFSGQLAEDVLGRLAELDNEADVLNLWRSLRGCEPQTPVVTEASRVATTGR